MAELEITQALMCAKAAKLAYAGQPDLARMATELGFGDCDTKLIEKSNHAAVVINHDDYTIFSFRGTELTDLRDWLSNIDVRPIEIHPGQVHSGFWNAMLLFSDELKEFESQINGRNAFLTGHSLGGAMACLAGVRIDRELTGIFTFAQPPVGNKQFAQKYLERFNKTYFRIINELDDVPKLPVPFLNPLNAFRPMGTAFRFFRNGELRTETSFLRSGRDAWESAKNPWEEVKKKIHSMDEHIRRLKLYHKSA